MCTFPDGCFRQRTYVAQGYVKGGKTESRHTLRKLKRGGGK